MIKVGEYVRTKKYGDIGKVIKKQNSKIYLDDTNNCFNRTIKKEEIVNHSKNIIDLIEVGDYVNGMEIDEFDDVEGNLYLGFPIYDDGLMNTISEFRPLDTVEIKSVVTKEQFASMEYKVKEE